MRPIDKFILHVAHNWRNELNEAYGKAQMQAFINKFKNEADDLNIQVSEDQIKKYIEKFDKLRQGGGKFAVDPMTLSLPQLMRLVSSVDTGKEEDDETEITPDVVYHEGPITIWNGNSDQNCLTYGRGGRWCITRGSWVGHRYSEDYSYPTFYIAKNTSLPDSDLLSWIVIAVREDGRYVLHKKNNTPHYPTPILFGDLLSQAPWLADIPNIQQILKYQPLTTKEKLSQKYKDTNVIDIREWLSSSFNFKKQYLVVKSQNLRSKYPYFSDISNDDFIRKVLPKYPAIADFISVTEGILDPIILLRNLDYFSNQQRKSITANLHRHVDIQNIKGNILPFDVKVLLTKLNKWALEKSQRVYVTNDNSTIVQLDLSDTTPKINLYQEEDDYINIKLTPRTIKYITQYPDLDKLPLSFLIKLSEDGLITGDILDSVVEKAKTDPNGAMIVKNIDGVEILLDSNTLSSYKIENGKISKIPFNDEKVQQAFTEEGENENFQRASIDLFNNSIIPANIDKDALISIISSTPLLQRITNRGDRKLILTSSNPNYPFAKIGIEDNNGKNNVLNISVPRPDSVSGWRNINFSISQLNDRDVVRDYYRSYFEYLRSINITYTEQEIMALFNSYSSNQQNKVAFVEANPPIAEDSNIVPVIYQGTPVFISRNNTSVSRQFNPPSGRFRNINIPPAVIRRLLGGEATAAEPETPTTQTTPGLPASPGERRRGRPAGVPNAPRDTTPEVTGGGDIDVVDRMTETGLLPAFRDLPRRDRSRLAVTDAVRENPNGDRGAARRNNQLAGRGRVGQVLSVGPSKIYIITLTGGGIIASINMQPGNRNYLLLQNGTMVTLNSPAELMSALQQRNLAEVRHYMVHDYIHHNPHHLDEVRELIKQHEARKK